MQLGAPGVVIPLVVTTPEEIEMPNRAVINVVGNRPFLVCAPGDEVASVAELMKAYQQGAVLVVSPVGELVGICTERDLCYKVLAAGLPANTPISAVMTRDPQAVPPNKALGHVLHLMFEGGFRHMPVVDESGVPLGLVSSRDALGLEIFRFAEEVAQREHLAEIL